MKVLITGSTAQHCSNLLAGKLTTFCGSLRKTLESQGHIVVQTRPSVDVSEDYLENFDHVFVGMTSPSSLSSNMFYGAAITAQTAERVGNLSLIIDTPEPYKLRAGMSHTVNNPQSLIKEFYKARYEYKKVCENEEKFKRVVDYCSSFLESPLPTVLSPTVPWFSTGFITNYLTNLDSENIVLLNFDKETILNNRNKLDKLQQHWACDNKTSTWTKKLSNTISKPVISYKHGPWADVEAVNAVLSGSVGSIVSAYRNGDCWWSPLISYSLSSGVPVVTEWRNSQVLGASWTYLAYNIELMSNSERKSLAKEQKMSYLSALSDTPDLEILFSEKTTNTL